MALESFKLNARLKFFAGQANRALAKTNRQFRKLKASIKGIGPSMLRVSQGLRGATVATAPFTLAAGFALKSFIDFEGQMKVVQSVLLATSKETEGLTSLTKQLGITTSFTATEAAQGAEFLSRAGLSIEDTMGALSGTLRAAEASGIGLADASRIVANQLGAFGFAGTEAGRVADVLALTSARTNTNFIELGDSMKFAAAAAKPAGISFEDTAASIGIIANAGIKGTLAGTAFKNALVKLVKPTKATIKFFGDQGLSRAIQDASGNMLPMPVIMTNIGTALAGLPTKAKKLAFAMEIFGLRGAAAFNAFDAQVAKTTKITPKNIGFLTVGMEKLVKSGEITKGKMDELLKEGSLPFITALRIQLLGAKGAVEKMAKIRLSSLKGQITLLTSAVTGFSIEIGGVLATGVRPLVEKAKDFFQVAALGFQVVTDKTLSFDGAMERLGDNQFKNFLQFAVDFAEGFIEGFDEVKAEARRLFKEIKEFLGETIDDSGLTAKEFGNIAAKVLTIGAVAAPILLAMAVGFFVLGSLANVFVLSLVLIGQLLTFLLPIMALVFSAGALALGVMAFEAGVFLAAILLIVVAIDLLLRLAGINLFEDSILSNIGGFLTGTAQSISGFFNFIGDISDKASALKGFIERGGRTQKSFDEKFGKGGFAVDPLVKKRGIFDTGPIRRTSQPGDPADIQRQSFELSRETLERTGKIAPRSENEMKAELIRQLRGFKSDGGGRQDLSLNVSFGKMRFNGKDILAAVTRATIDNAEANGRQVIDKRKKLQNGFSNA